MKNIMTFSTIVAVHLVAFIMIAVQPACTSNRDLHESPQDMNRELSSNTQVILPERELAEGSPALRAAPSRPAWTLDGNKKKNNVIVNQENQTPVNSGLLMPTELDDKVEVDSVVQASAMPESYTVKTGDNLTKIAKANKTTVAAIKSLNNLNSNNIRVGQKLKIPAPNMEEPKASESNTALAENIYVVKSGDSLSVVAQKNQTSIAAIKEINALRNDVIFVGQKLKIPSPSETASAVSAPRATPSQEAKNDKYETYIVKRGDMLGGIALKHKISLAQIQKLNPSIDPNRLQIGQVVIIREKATSSTPVIVKENTPATVQKEVIVQPAPPIKDKAEPTTTPKVEVEPVAPAPEPVEEPQINIINI